jgi:hypothetical protein
LSSCTAWSRDCWRLIAVGRIVCNGKPARKRYVVVGASKGVPRTVDEGGAFNAVCNQLGDNILTRRGYPIVEKSSKVQLPVGQSTGTLQESFEENAPELTAAGMLREATLSPGKVE